jgi:hypothetical protein
MDLLFHLLTTTEHRHCQLHQLRRSRQPHITHSLKGKKCH